jgi:ParB-like chromosome segregation protein Spo0J
MEKAKYQEGLGMKFAVNDIYENIIEVSKIRSEKSMEKESYKGKYEVIKETIRDQGQLVPMILRTLTDQEKEDNNIRKDIVYGVLSGRTRLKVIRELGLDTVLAIVSDVKKNDDDIKTAAIENFARVEMTEEDKQAVVHWFRKSINQTTDKPYTVSEIAGILCVSKSYVNKLDKMIFEKNTNISAGTILTVEEIKTKITKEKVFDKIAAVKDNTPATEKITIADEITLIINGLMAERTKLNKDKVVRSKRKENAKAKQNKKKTE